MATPASRADAAQFRYGQSRLQDHGAGQIQGLGPADRQIVDGAADRQAADVAAGKEARTHHEAVRGQGQTVAEGRAHRAVAQLLEGSIIKGGQEDLLHQFPI